ncbi:hypothetical protein HPB51_020641 [Rhipicephalus microplus]|uniref:Histone-lysine N-methyltransferase MLL3 n=1 Tax=Rhipicephalus microplus TaxID=6941 RepID=A0A9J6DQ21_RHIMP|nr:hypothetical protein HPB51_020641 [Rhipicephalus microplus]
MVGSIMSGEGQPGQSGMPEPPQQPPQHQQPQQQQFQQQQQQQPQQPVRAGGMSSTDAASSAAGANAGSETLQTQPAKKKTAGDLVKEVEAQGTEEPDDGGGDMEDDLDDDELLGLGNDFNILEYADPELDRAFVGEGEKSNILDEHLDLDDKEDDLDEVGRQETDTKDDDAAMPQGGGGVKQEPMVKQEERKTEDHKPSTLGFSTFSTEGGASNQQQQPTQPQQQEQQQQQGQLQQHQQQQQLMQQQHQMPKMPMFENRPPMNVVPTASFTMAGQHPGLRGMRPPPPYAGGATAMPGVRMMAHSMPGPAMSHLRGSLAGMRPPVASVPIPGPAMGGSSPGDHRPLLLQEQPLLLEDLVEQEKREQRKQSGEAATASLLSDVDFERLKADVLSGPPDDSIGAPAPVMPQAALLPAMPQQHPVNPGQLVGNPGQRYLQMQGGPAGWPTSGMVAGPAQAGGPHLMRQLPVGPGGPMVSPGGTMHLVRTEQGAIRVMGGPPPHRPPDQLGHVGTHAGVAGGGGALVSPGDGGAAQVPFQIQTLPAPPTPSLCIGQDPPPGAMVAAYEQWLAQQDALLSSQKKTLEGEVGKLRKAKKALSTKQRQLAKTGQELPQQNALELQRIAQQQPGMQKNLDQVGDSWT